MYIHVCTCGNPGRGHKWWESLVSVATIKHLLLISESIAVVSEISTWLPSLALRLPWSPSWLCSQVSSNQRVSKSFSLGYQQPKYVTGRPVEIFMLGTRQELKVEYPLKIIICLCICRSCRGHCLHCPQHQSSRAGRVPHFWLLQHWEWKAFAKWWLLAGAIRRLLWFWCRPRSPGLGMLRW